MGVFDSKKNIFGKLSLIQKKNQTTEITMKRFSTIIYPKTHWALQPYSLAESKVIAFFRYKNHRYAVYLNPTDSRGCRAIVRLINNDDMQSTLNREFSFDEQRGLNLCSEYLERVYQLIFPIVQVFKAGNNSQKMENGEVIIGVEDEPNFLHIHVIGRGNPTYCYVPDISLKGPSPGLNFDMMGKTMDQPGNEKKIPWASDEEMIKAKNFIQKFLIEFAPTEYSDVSVNFIYNAHKFEPIEATTPKKKKKIANYKKLDVNKKMF